MSVAENDPIRPIGSAGRGRGGTASNRKLPSGHLTVQRGFVFPWARRLSMLAATHHRPAHVLISGGAGFIGANLTAHLLAATDARITIFDNLSHPGAEANLAWLRSQARADRLRFLRGDVRS